MIVKNLKYSRELLNFKQVDIARELKVNNSTVSGWENGKDTIPIRKLIEYANKYNYSLDYLFGITDDNLNYYPIIVNLEAIAKNLKVLRILNNKTQSEVAISINTTQQTYSHYECAINIIPTTFLYNLTMIYKKFSIDELFNRKRK